MTDETMNTKQELLSTWHNLRELERDGMRVPTIFELIKMRESGATGSDWVWSSSPNADYSYNAWRVNFDYGNGGNGSKYDPHYVRLVRGAQSFDHWTPVTVEEVRAFRRTGELPDWHPPLDVSMTDGTRGDEQGPVAAECPNERLATCDELREICELTVRLVELRQNECKHLSVENVAPEIFHKLLSSLLFTTMKRARRPE